MLELLAPAGSPEAVVAAVQNGADAIYLGFGDYNARRNAKNFTEDDFARAAEYCRVRGVKTYVTLNTLASDRELPNVAEFAKKASRLGADAILVQDLGVLHAVRQVVPDMPVHGSTQMSVHDLEGVRMAAAMGAERVVLARELPKDAIEYICRNSPIEIEVFAHGALCMSYSGQCYMSAVIGRRSGNRGLCAQPCRLDYSAGGRSSSYPLSLRDNCLVGHISELERIGVKCLKIEGRMRRPEYVAIVTSIYSRAIREGKRPSAEDMELLQRAFSRQGFTDGFYTGKTGREMFGVRTAEDKREIPEFAAARKGYLNGEFQRVPVKFIGVVKEGKPAELYAGDDRGNTAKAVGAVPEPAFHRELTPTTLQTQLYKTGGTPFFCDGVKSTVDKGLALSASAINEMRRSVLSEIYEKRRPLAERREGELFLHPAEKGYDAPPVITMSVLRANQLTPALAETGPKVLYLPLTEFASAEKKLQPFVDMEDCEICPVLPRVIRDSEKPEIQRMLTAAKAKYGIENVLAGNLGHLLMLRRLGFGVRGDFGLNAYNSQTMTVLRGLGLKSATVSFEMRMEQIRDISKPLDTEMIVYGRLPLMVTENCIVKSATGHCSCENFPGITDRTGFTFPVVKEFGCRSVILNSKKLFLADRRETYEKCGLWGARLVFTTENPIECTAIARRFAGSGDYEPGPGFTRGLYTRGVE